MKLFAVMAGLAILLLALTAKAQVFAGYDAFCGLPVIVGTDPQTASARTDSTGGKYIHIDPYAMENWTASRMFVLAHECAHHRLGHTSFHGQAERFYGGTAKQELEADCWAATALRSIGSDFEITRTVLSQSNQGHFSSAGYPSGAMRAQNIDNCARASPGPVVQRCHDVQVNEPFWDVQTVMQQVQMPCQHCGCNPYGQCGCAHPFDPVPQPVQVPIQRTRTVIKKVCN